MFSQYKTLSPNLDRAFLEYLLQWRRGFIAYDFMIIFFLKNNP